MRLAAVCAIYGGYDLIPPVPDGVDDAVLVTDVPVRSGWRNVVEPSTSDPRLAAKRPKARPDLYTDCDASLWIDGSIHVHDDRFVELVRAKLETHELVLWDHPESRDCIVQEAQHCHQWTKYRDEPLLDQVHRYLLDGMPQHFGLWALGSIARRHTSAMARLGDDWLLEMKHWTTKDQVSLPYLLWREGISPGTFGINQLQNQLVVLIPHREQVYAYRNSILQREAEIIRLGGQVNWLEQKWGEAQTVNDQLRRRRAVRIALRLSRLVRPIFRAVRWLR